MVLDNTSGSVKAVGEIDGIQGGQLRSNDILGNADDSL